MPKQPKQDTKESTRVNIIKQEKKNFVIVYDSVYKSNLSMQALGVLVKLLASAPTFKITTRNIERAYNITNYTLKKTIKELKDKGFLTIENNTKKGSTWTIRQEPIIEIKTDIKTLVDALLDNLININQLKALLRHNKIDMTTYTQVLHTYLKELERIIKTNPYEED